MALQGRLVATPLAVATNGLHYRDGPLLKHRRDSCSASEVECAFSCITQGSDCCDQITGYFCHPGLICVYSGGGGGGGCCPDTEQGCDLGCIPSGSNCCNYGDSSYCDAGYQCVSDFCEPEDSTDATTTVTPSSEPSSRLSTGAQVGIGVGCAVAGLAIAGIFVWFICFYRRRKKAQAIRNETSQWTPAQPQPTTPHAISPCIVSTNPASPSGVKSDSGYHNTQTVSMASTPAPTGSASVGEHSRLGSWSSPAEASGDGAPTAYRSESYVSYAHLHAAELPASSREASQQGPERTSPYL
jgi:hypothetical protein